MGTKTDYFIKVSINFKEYSKGALIIFKTFFFNPEIKKMLEIKTNNKTLTNNLTIWDDSILIPSINPFISYKLALVMKIRIMNATLNCAINELKSKPIIDYFKNICLKTLLYLLYSHYFPKNYAFPFPYFFCNFRVQRHVKLKSLVSFHIHNLNLVSRNA